MFEKCGHCVFLILKRRADSGCLALTMPRKIGLARGCSSSNKYVMWLNPNDIEFGVKSPLALCDSFGCLVFYRERNRGKSTPWLLVGKRTRCLFRSI